MSDLYPFRDDYISTSEIARRLGFSMTAAFIQNTLDVKPSFRAGQIGGTYWSPEGAQRVYEALIRHVEAVAAAGRASKAMMTTAQSQMTGKLLDETETKEQLR